MPGLRREEAAVPAGVGVSWYCRPPRGTGAALRRAITAGELTVQVATLAPGRVAEAHRRIESGPTTGKLVLEVPARPGPRGLGPGRGRASDQFAMAANMPAS